MGVGEPGGLHEQEITTRGPRGTPLSCRPGPLSHRVQPEALGRPPPSTPWPWVHEALLQGPLGRAAALGLPEPEWEMGEGQQLSNRVPRGDTCPGTSSALGIQSAQELDQRTLLLGS